MRTVVQISDLHFGTILDETVAPLLACVRKLRPDVTVVSGDLTQRAKELQFREARAFIDQLPEPRLVVPGNHDVPLYDIVRRFAAPLARYTKFISADLAPTYVDDEIAVVAINTARSFVVKGGHVSDLQVAMATREFGQLSNGQARIVVTHHPFDIPLGLSGVAIVRGAASAMHAFAESEVDLFMAGHLHLVHFASTSRFVPSYNAPIVGAGTATSTRARGEPNSFCEYRIERRLITAIIHTWQSDRGEFTVTSEHEFARQSQAKFVDGEPYTHS